MADQQENLYKGYHIVTSSDGGTSPPYRAIFGIAQALPGGKIGPTNTQHCNATYQNEQDAHAAANITARKFIDSMLAKK